MRSVEPPPLKPNEPVLDAYRGQAVAKRGQVSAPASQYEAASTDGVNLRARPDGTLPHIAKVRYGTDVQVQALDTTGAFAFVVAPNGAVGWINKDFVRAWIRPTSAPTCTTSPRDNLTTILKNEYIDKGLWRLATGNDYTTLAAAVVVANIPVARASSSIGMRHRKVQAGPSASKVVLDPWMIDNFAIYHGIDDPGRTQHLVALAGRTSGCCRAPG